MRPRKLPEGKSALNELYNRYKKGAKIRGIDFYITLEKFEKLTSMNCHYCGSYPKNKVFTEKKMKIRKTNGNYVYNGIDRKNNSLGYFFENCIPSCSICNLGKHTKSYEEFLEYLDSLVKFRSKNESLS